MKALTGCLQHPEQIHGQWFTPDLFRAGQEEFDVDFDEIVGLPLVRQATEAAAAGRHNILYIGPAGTGKTMAARRIPTILPPLTLEESIEVSKIYSICGLLKPDTPLVLQRPFRSPHHSTTAQAMAGGGRNPKPGEISLASYGTLFLDELTEFQPKILDLLRQPMEEGSITVSRLNQTVVFPAKTMIAAAMNPCKCGWYGTERCTCTKAAVQQYLHRLSGPLLDRIDLQVAVQPVEYAALAARGQASEEHSADIRARVLAARERQYARQGADVCNAAIPPPQLAEHCPLSADASRMFAAAFQRLGLTARAHDRVLRVARTIADLADSSVIEAEHLAEALQYRSLDRAAGS